MNSGRGLRYSCGGWKQALSAPAWDRTAALSWFRTNLRSDGTFSCLPPASPALSAAINAATFSTGQYSCRSWRTRLVASPTNGADMRGGAPLHSGRRAWVLHQNTTACHTGDRTPALGLPARRQQQMPERLRSLLSARAHLRITCRRFCRTTCRLTPRRALGLHTYRNAPGGKRPTRLQRAFSPASPHLRAAACAARTRTRTATPRQLHLCAARFCCTLRTLHWMSWFRFARIPAAATPVHCTPMRCYTLPQNTLPALPLPANATLSHNMLLRTSHAAYAAHPSYHAPYAPPLHTTTPTLLRTCAHAFQRACL